MKRTAIIIVLLAIAIAIGGYKISNILSSERLKKEQENTIAEKKKRIEMKVQEMAAKFNAVTDREDVFEELNLRDKIYTVELQEALIRPDRRPFLIYVLLNDILKRENEYILRLTTPIITLELRCPEELARKAIRLPTSYSEVRLAIIAKIEKIKKPIFVVRSTGNDEDDGEVEVNSSNIFVATGECLDLIHLGTDNN